MQKERILGLGCVWSSRPCCHLFQVALDPVWALEINIKACSWTWQHLPDESRVFFPPRSLVLQLMCSVLTIEFLKDFFFLILRTEFWHKTFRQVGNGRCVCRKPRNSCLGLLVTQEGNIWMKQGKSCFPSVWSSEVLKALAWVLHWWSVCPLSVKTWVHPQNPCKKSDKIVYSLGSRAARQAVWLMPGICEPASLTYFSSSKETPCLKYKVGPDKWLSGKGAHYQALWSEFILRTCVMGEENLLLQIVLCPPYI